MDFLWEMSLRSLRGGARSSLGEVTQVSEERHPGLS